MMAGGLEPITEGAITVGGKATTGPRQDVGIMFQDPTLLPWKSAIENVLFPYRVFNRPMDEARVRAEALLDQVGLNGFYDHKPGQLSGGMRQRVAICRALIYAADDDTRARAAMRVQAVRSMRDECVNSLREIRKPKAVA